MSNTKNQELYPEQRRKSVHDKGIKDKSQEDKAINANHSDDKNDSDRGLKDKSKRNFLGLSASAVACVGAAVALVPFVKSLGPDAKELAMGSTEVDISKVEAGQTITVMWRGTPVFVRKRTPQEIEDARRVDLGDLKDPEPDENRVLNGKEEWLVTVAVCTHLGCVPLANKGDYNGWFCPCHGSHYDTSGRIRKGPAPTNLPIPSYTFVNENMIRIG